MSKHHRDYQLTILPRGTCAWCVDKGGFGVTPVRIAGHFFNHTHPTHVTVSYIYDLEPGTGRPDPGHEIFLTEQAALDRRTTKISALRNYIKDDAA